MGVSIVREERKVKVEAGLVGVLKQSSGFLLLEDFSSGFFDLTGFLEVDVLGVTKGVCVTVEAGFGI